MSASPNPPHSSSSASGPNAAGDTQILCKWKDCGLMFDDAETIYKHLCEDHVGRKSTGNLCLQCKWEGCDASSAAKRHHITSHLIVHTPFKPHSCSFCNKTFKRPQDLKKHERIHDNSTSRAKAANASSSAPKDLYPHPAHNQMQLEAAQRANAMYASHHGHHPGANLQPHGGYPQVSYPQVKRELTPNYGEASSSASLSPLSSHLGTPANGNSPSVYPNQYNNGGSYGQYPQPSHYNSHQQFHHQQPQQQQLYQMNAGSYMGLVPPSSMTKQEITPQHQPHPNDAYSYLGQGTHHAGSKRGYEEMLVGDFADDVRKKRITTNYNEEMASRLNSISQYSSGFDDGTINGLFSSDVPGWNSNGDDGSRSAGGNTDLAQLNSFLLQLGANIAGNDVKPEETSTSSSASSSSQSQPALSPNSHSSASSHAASPPDSSSSSSEHHFNANNNKSEIHFDLSGLNGIQGFDESLLQGVNWSSSDNHDDFFNHQTFAPRPIAHLPSRSHGQQPMGFGGQGQNYTHTSYPQTGFGQGQTTSFDSLRTSRGPALVPQLAQLDSVNHNYRKVEALQRAAPIVGSGGPTTLPSYSGKNASNDEEMEEVDNKEHSSSSYRQRSSSPAVSEASSRTSSSATSSPAPITHGLYPKMTSVSVGDPSRRLPTPLTSSSSGGPSISSILASSTTTDAASFTQHQRAGSYTTRNTSNLRTGFRDQSEDNASDDTGNSTPLGSTRSRSASYGLESPRVNNNATPSKIYPSLPSDDNMEVDEVHNEMSNLGLANKNSKVVMDVETRKRHLDLIRRLLIAINYPQQQRRETIEEDGSDSGSESDSSIERDLPPMKNGSDSIQQDSSPLPGIDQLLKAGGHRRKSISSSKSQQQQHHHQQRQQTSERLPGVDV